MINPQTFEGEFGNSLQLACKDGKNVLWFFEKSKSHPVSDPINSGETLIIENIQSYQSGNYFCYGQYLNRDVYFLSRAVVKIYGMLLYCILNF